MAETIAEIAGLLKLGPDAPLQPPRFAKVVSVADDTVTVTLGASAVEAVRCCHCVAGDIVLLETMPSGQLAAVATRSANGIVPTTSATYNLGTNAKRWANLYVGTVFADRLRSNNTHYGTCNTAAGTAAKVVTCTGFSLVRGAVVCVYAETNNTVTSNMTLNVNNQGAKTVSRKGSASGMPQWVAKSMLIFCYDGTYWRFCGGDWQ